MARRGLLVHPAQDPDSISKSLLLPPEYVLHLNASHHQSCWSLVHAAGISWLDTVAASQLVSLLFLLLLVLLILDYYVDH